MATHAQKELVRVFAVTCAMGGPILAWFASRDGWKTAGSGGVLIVLVVLLYVFLDMFRDAGRGEGI
jgi:hypothetical protein